mmetsp:Transcript_23736/g.23422  ORF Transcript_23736/g.23422 Transcript_23736/m.23422 type:complete len:87 (+) Transcript_23736:374-634(+)
MRGQAFIVFHDEEQAEEALQALRGYVFFSKPLRINFAKRESDVISKMRGTYDEEAKAQREQKNIKEKHEREIKRKKKLIDKLIKLR